MTLYHASTLCIDKPDVLHSRDNLDFGKGFYLTSLYEQAIRYSERFTRRGKEAFINVYELDEEIPGFTIFEGRGIGSPEIREAQPSIVYSEWRDAQSSSSFH